jgi:hypothetical protein
VTKNGTETTIKTTKAVMPGNEHFVFGAWYGVPIGMGIDVYSGSALGWRLAAVCIIFVYHSGFP